MVGIGVMIWRDLDRGDHCIELFAKWSRSWLVVIVVFICIVVEAVASTVGLESRAVRGHEEFVKSFNKLGPGVFVFLRGKSTLVTSDTIEEVTILGVSEKNVKLGVIIHRCGNVGNVSPELLEVNKQLPIF